MCRQFNVTGGVQGVFYRVSAREIAERLGLHGHAINLADGSVEVRACGEDGAIDELARWLHEGPRMASVEGVTETPVECSRPGRFTTG